MPSVLIEIGYLTHKEEEKYLADQEGQEQTIEALFQGLSSYMQQLGAELQPVKPIAESPRENPGKKVSQTVPVSTEKPELPPVDRNLMALQKASEPAPNLRRSTTPAPEEVEYFVQLAASSSQERSTQEDWKTLGSTVRYVREGSMYKYQAGPFKTRAEAEALRKLAREREFEGAFIVAYRNGRKLNKAEMDQLR